jgi:hypothetical protein
LRPLVKNATAEVVDPALAIGARITAALPPFANISSISKTMVRANASVWERVPLRAVERANRRKLFPPGMDDAKTTEFRTCSN